MKRDAAVRRGERTILAKHIVERIRHPFIFHRNTASDVLRQGLADTLHIGGIAARVFYQRLCLLHPYRLRKAVDRTQRQVQFTPQAAGILRTEVNQESLPEQLLRNRHRALRLRLRHIAEEVVQVNADRQGG